MLESMMEKTICYGKENMRRYLDVSRLVFVLLHVFRHIVLLSTRPTC